MRDWSCLVTGISGNICFVLFCGSTGVRTALWGQLRSFLRWAIINEKFPELVNIGHCKTTVFIFSSSHLGYEGCLLFSRWKVCNVNIRNKKLFCIQIKICCKGCSHKKLLKFCYGLKKQTKLFILIHMRLTLLSITNVINKIFLSVFWSSL